MQEILEDVSGNGKDYSQMLVTDVIFSLIKEMYVWVDEVTKAIGFHFTCVSHKKKQGHFTVNLKMSSIWKV